MIESRSVAVDSYDNIYIIGDYLVKYNSSGIHLWNKVLWELKFNLEDTI